MRVDEVRVSVRRVVNLDTNKPPGDSSYESFAYETSLTVVRTDDEETDDALVEAARERARAEMNAYLGPIVEARDKKRAEHAAARQQYVQHHAPTSAGAPQQTPTTDGGRYVISKLRRTNTLSGRPVIEMYQANDKYPRLRMFEGQWELLSDIGLSFAQLEPGALTPVTPFIANWRRGKAKPDGSGYYSDVTGLEPLDPNG